MIDGFNRSSHDNNCVNHNSTELKIDEPQMKESAVSIVCSHWPESLHLSRQRTDLLVAIFPGSNDKKFEER